MFVTSAATASAQTAADRATAQSLFESGKRLLDQKDYVPACRQLEESQRLDPSQGTQFRLASCFEALGRTASAWAAYLEVAEAAKATKQPDRERVARERAKALAAQLPYLTLRAAEPSVQIRRDDAVVPAGQLGARVAIDPGKHKIEARASGFETWTQEIEIAPAKELTVDIPALTPAKEVGSKPAPVAVPGPSSTAVTASPAPPPAEPPSSAPTGMGTQRKAALVVGGLGVAAAAGSVVFGLLAKGANDDSSTHCRAGNRCDPTGLDQRDTALSRATVATVLGVVSGVALAGGGTLWITGKPNATQVGTNGSTLLLSRTF